MKKHLLTALMLVVSAGFSFAQFTITGTSITFTGSTPPGAGTAGQFYSYQPNNSGGTFYSDNTCSTVLTQGTGASELGGFDPAVFDATTAASPRPGIIFYGGRIRTVYYGAPCTAQMPSFGFHTGNSGGIGTGTDVNLSAPANQKIQFTYQSDLAISLEINFLNSSYANEVVGATVNLLGDGAQHTVTVDFSPYVGSSPMNDIRQVSFVYTSTTLSGSFGISLSDIKVGSVLAGTNNASSLVASSNLYPNPATGTAKVELELKSSANVKIVLNDIYGKEVKVIAEKSSNSISESFDVSNLNKGIYMVSYLVDGVPAKSEKLVIK